MPLVKPTVTRCGTDWIASPFEYSFLSTVKTLAPLHLGQCPWSEKSAHHSKKAFSMDYIYFPQFISCLCQKKADKVSIYNFTHLYNTRHNCYETAMIMTVTGMALSLSIGIKWRSSTHKSKQEMGKCTKAKLTSEHAFNAWDTIHSWERILKRSQICTAINLHYAASLSGSIIWSA